MKPVYVPKTAEGLPVAIAVEMPRSQMLTLTIDFEGRKWRIEEDMPPLIPSDRLHQPTVSEERQVRIQEWAHLGRRMLNGLGGWLTAMMREGIHHPTHQEKRMNFGDAIAALKGGSSVQRAGWNGKGMYLGLQRPDAHSSNTLPYIYMITVTGDRVPWLASQTDMLAEDWSIVYP